MNIAFPLVTSGVRPSIPAPGSSLVAATEARAVHIRLAVEVVRRSFGDRESATVAWVDILASRWRKEQLASSEALALQTAWALVSMRVVGRSVGALSANATLRDAEAWFLGSIRPPSSLADSIDAFANREAVRALEAVAYDDDLRDLLPYVLDALGPGSRASVMRDSSTQQSRQAKKATGVFYTPSDVAEYITRAALDEFGQGTSHPSILDPACGSGIFLKAALDLALAQQPGLDPFEFAERNLYGIDINPLAIDAACFVLLHQCLRADHRERNASPWSLWHRIRCNLYVTDALIFQVVAPSEDCSETLTALREALQHSYISPSAEQLDAEATLPLFSNGLALGSVFPSLANGADVIVGNPPYATIGPRDDTVALKHRFASLLNGDVASSDYFPVFIEMMWRFARPGRSSSGMVVPLSLAYSRRAQIVATRRAIMSSGGRWRFAFFDRQPHALFGEEVKTRNTILFRCECDATPRSLASVETGPLRKWTSRQRAQLFEAIAFAPIDSSIAYGIPKVAGDVPAQVFAKLSRRTSRLREMCEEVSACLPESAASNHPEARVFVAGTAYNFLNVFRHHRQLPAPRAPWSTSKLLSLAFGDEDKAARAFAILSSRVAYWLWHVSEDGFHVTRRFVVNLPFTDRLFSETERDALAFLGSRLWEDVQSQQITSVNGGRQTVAYRPHASGGLRDEIDALLLGALDVAPSFIDYLRSFTRSIVAVDEDDATRRRFTNHFSEGGRRCPE